MKFFSPWSLAWLGLLVPVIVFFYLLKLKRKEVTVSSVLLWNHLVKDVQANAPFQKLRRNLLLLLQLLIAAFAIFALSRPAVYANALGGSHVVLILDGSASMQSRDVSGSRFDAAKATALKMVNDMHGGDQMMVLLATQRTHRLTAFTGDQNELRRVITDAKARDTGTNLRDAILLAASAAGQRAGSQIYVLSDGAFDGLDDIDTRGSAVQFVKFGQRADNVGIVAMDVRRMFRDEGGYQLFLAVRNFSDQRKRGTLEFYRNDALIDARPIELPPADKINGFSERAEVLQDLPEMSGILRARLDLPDDLAVDNEAYAQLSTRRDLNVLLVTDGNLYLEKALNVDPHVKLSRVTPSGYTGQGEFDVTIFEGFTPKQPGPGAHLYINAGGPTAPVDVKGKITDASILDYDRTHSVMRYVKLSQLNLQEALAATRKPWAVALAEHESGVAIALGERAGTKSAYIGFPLLKSDFPLRVAFPIFFNNLVQWLAARPGRTEGLQLRAGQVAPIEVPAELTEVRVTLPDGKREQVPTDGRVSYFGNTEQRGLYLAEGKGFKHEFAVNLLSRDESDIRPKDRIKLGNRPIFAGSGSVKTAREFWRWLLLAAVLILAIEWWVYHRRL